MTTLDDIKKAAAQQKTKIPDPPRLLMNRQTAKDFFPDLVIPEHNPEEIKRIETKLLETLNNFLEENGEQQ